MNNLFFGLSVMAVGMIVVFLGLVILIGCIWLLTRFTGQRRDKKPEEAVQPPAAQALPAEEVQPEEEAQPGDDGLIAAITAAIACVWDKQDTGFVVRRVRRIYH